MTYEEHLKNLNADRTTTVDEIKSEYRRLAKKYHPDLGGDAAKFQMLTASYDWLLLNHVPAKKRRDTTNYQRFFRVFGPLAPVLITDLPYSSVVTEDTVICGMFKDKEFRVILDKGTKLPLEIMILNIADEPKTMIIKGARRS